MQATYQIQNADVGEPSRWDENRMHSTEVVIFGDATFNEKSSIHIEDYILSDVFVDIQKIIESNHSGISIGLACYGEGKPPHLVFEKLENDMFALKSGSVTLYFRKNEIISEIKSFWGLDSIVNAFKRSGIKLVENDNGISMLDHGWIHIERA